MTVELSIPPKRAFYILTKARAFDEKVEETDPDSGSNPADDKMIDILESVRDDPTYEELLEAVRTCNIDEQTDLLALIWIGRGDFAPEDWEEARAQAAEIADEHVAEYITGTPLAGDYLEEALTGLGYSMEELETGRS